MSLTKNRSDNSGRCETQGDGYMGNGGCSVFVQGPESCAFAGNEIWSDYQQIRNEGGCAKCGTKTYSDGCMVTINYVSDCHTGGG